MSTSSTPLSDEEFLQLDELLSPDDADTLSIDEAHGYSTALIVGNIEAHDGEWLEAILGDKLDSCDEAIPLLQRMYSETEAALAAGERFEPMIIEEEIDGEAFESYEGWCFGFMLGVTQHQQHWDELPSNKEELLAPIAQLALLHTEEEPDIDEEEYADCVELIPGAVTKLYEHWR